MAATLADLCQLTPRQEALYLRLVKIYRATAGIDVRTKERSDDTYAVVVQQGVALSAVPCWFAYTQNDSDPTGVGRMKRRSALTEDKLKVPAQIDLRDGDFVVDVTAGDENYGSVSRVQGEPRIRATRGNRTTNERVVQLMTEADPPSEVVP